MSHACGENSYYVNTVSPTEPNGDVRYVISQDQPAMKTEICFRTNVEVEHGSIRLLHNTVRERCHISSHEVLTVPCSNRL